MDKFKDKILKEWSESGFHYFQETIWSSSLQQKELGRIRDFLTNNGINNVDVSIVIPETDDTTKLKWITYYDKSGQCCSTNRNINIPAQSNNLKLTFCYTNKQVSEEQKQQVHQVTSALRLIFGVPIARELLFTREFSNDEDLPISHSETGFASYFDSQGLNLFDEPPIQTAKIIDIPKEAALLIDKALSLTFPPERFVLMWLAFEAIINSFQSNANNGKKREKFFKEELQSELLNDEVYRLFRLRCDLFKEGKESTLKSLESDCWSLYKIIQITILKNCIQRDAFINGLEKQLSPLENE
ncbi:hypothetical protein OH456_12600 [Vibrio sp. La 4.2.2]|uniref:hypothetical protein n=1 Tax=Vibrio sp. La 4.2.2 TaxID=2998830 RepID=UPI0022CDEA26|nr:hypothetical protein [Vibrio sp. La 4.2.2]MDA0109000.1 hypothetical protein [Vibrio sp. La 4.2.2]